MFEPLHIAEIAVLLALSYVVGLVLGIVARRLTLRQPKEAAVVAAPVEDKLGTPVPAEAASVASVAAQPLEPVPAPQPVTATTEQPSAPAPATEVAAVPLVAEEAAIRWYDVPPAPPAAPVVDPVPAPVEIPIAVIAEPPVAPPPVVPPAKPLPLVVTDDSIVVRELSPVTIPVVALPEIQPQETSPTSAAPVAELAAAPEPSTTVAPAAQDTLPGEPPVSAAPEVAPATPAAPRAEAAPPPAPAPTLRPPDFNDLLSQLTSIANKSRTARTALELREEAARASTSSPAETPAPVAPAPPATPTPPVAAAPPAAATPPVPPGKPAALGTGPNAGRPSRVAGLAWSGMLRGRTALPFIRPGTTSSTRPASAARRLASAGGEPPAIARPTARPAASAVPQTSVSSAQAPAPVSAAPAAAPAPLPLATNSAPPSAPAIPAAAPPSNVAPALVAEAKPAPPQAPPASVAAPPSAPATPAAAPPSNVAPAPVTEVMPAPPSMPHAAVAAPPPPAESLAAAPAPIPASPPPPTPTPPAATEPLPAAPLGALAAERPEVQDASLRRLLAESIASTLEVDPQLAFRAPPAAPPVAPKPTPEPANSLLRPRPAVPASSPRETESDAMRAIEGGWSFADALDAVDDEPELPDLPEVAPTPPPAPTTRDVGAAVTAAQIAVETVLARTGIDPEVSSGAVRPKGLPRPRNGKRDNLQAIAGLGPLDEIALHNLGIYHYDQIMEWDQRAILWLENHAFARGRIAREQWQAQAARLVTPTIDEIRVSRT